MCAFRSRLERLSGEDELDSDDLNSDDISIIRQRMQSAKSMCSSNSFGALISTAEYEVHALPPSNLYMSSYFHLFSNLLSTFRKTSSENHYEISGTQII